jgi:phage terminase large subunit-like protein
MVAARTGEQDMPPTMPSPWWAEDDPLPAWLARIADDESYGWAITGWKKAAAQPGAWFDHAKADAVVDLWPKTFKLTNDRFAGVPFRLNLWQEINVRLLFGWKHPIEIVDPWTGETVLQHVRIFQTLRLWIPRKNGKSEFLAALALMFWAMDGVHGGEGFVFARDEEQAEIPFNKMKAMIALSDTLSADIQVHTSHMWLKPLASSFLLLTGGQAGKHGKGPTVTLGDEMHEWKSRKIEDDLRGGQGSRLEPIGLFASTAGLKTNPTGVELWEESEQILSGDIDNPAVLVVIFAAPENADWEDETVWRQANPSLGLSPTLQFLRGEARAAKGSPAKEARFKCYHLNQWVDDHALWLPPAKWKACKASDWRTMAERMRGRRCFGAFDLSATIDVTAHVWLFEPTTDDPLWRLLPRFWMPEGMMAKRISETKIAWDKWHAAGAVEVTPGDQVDQDYVKQAIAWGRSEFELVLTAYDPWNATKLLTDLQKEGFEAEDFREVRQGIRSLGEATKEFERMVYSTKLDHGGHPVLEYMARNTMIRFDENLNYMPAKKRSKDKIDGIVAAVMARAVSMAGEAPEIPPEIILL